MVAKRRPPLVPGDMVEMADGRQARIEETTQWYLTVAFRKRADPGKRAGKFGQPVDMSRQAFWRDAA